MEDNKELVFRIQKLINENKELNSQLKDLKQKNEKLEDDNRNFKHLIAKIPEDVLPKGLKSAPKSKTLRFKMATVLYLDIQGFKKISESMTSNQVIDELDQIIFHFNEIVEKYKIQKIKTIGDAYMCAGGVPVKNITNPIDVVLAALEMEDYLGKLKDEYEKQDRKFWDLRLGIHTGAVTATMQGRKKISYDLKGDTVNIATRMAAASDVGMINMSVMTYELVKPYFDCEYYGKIPVKYKGDMEMYFLKRIKKRYSEDRKIGTRPNEIFRVKYLIRQFTDLQEMILDKLERELPEYLYYHNYKHTIEITIPDPVFNEPANVFTPNNDGINDYFKLDVEDLASLEGWVYSRWGKTVCRWKSVEEAQTGWDGKIKGSNTDAVAGVYYYYIKAVDYFGEEIVKKGAVHLFRK